MGLWSTNDINYIWVIQEARKELQKKHKKD